MLVDGNMFDEEKTATGTVNVSRDLRVQEVDEYYQPIGISLNGADMQWLSIADATWLQHRLQRLLG